MASPEFAPPLAPDQLLDAGELGCGDLVLLLKRALDAMAPGSVLELHARDGGAAADIPAWCRLTRHELVRVDGATHRYWIRRRPH